MYKYRKFLESKSKYQPKKKFKFEKNKITNKFSNLEQ